MLHQNARRVQSVTANVSGRDVASFVADAKRKIAEEVALPPGVHVEFAGAAEAQAQSQRDFLVNASLAGIGIVLMLSIVTGHWRNLILEQSQLPATLFCDFSKQAALLISLLRLRAAFAISTVATCILQAGSMRSFAFRHQGCRMLFIRFVNRAVQAVRRSHPRRAVAGKR